MDGHLAPEISSFCVANLRNSCLLRATCALNLKIPEHEQASSGTSQRFPNKHRLRRNGTDLSRYGLFAEETSAAGTLPSSLHGRVYGVFRKKLPVSAGRLLVDSR